MPDRKRRTRQHVIADLSMNHVERFILRCGWVARRMNPDYGIGTVLRIAFTSTICFWFVPNLTVAA